jgi:prepilin-type processing-associated H-X9-DG protein
MTTPLHHQLLGYLLGALDDDEQQRLEERLEHDEESCRELTRWRKRLAPLELMRPDFEPPPGLVERTCGMVAAYRAATERSGGWGWRRRMTPSPIPPAHAPLLSFLDAAVMVVLLITGVLLILPAIGHSRLQARLVVCQDALRQFGRVLSDYGRQQGSTLSQLANHGRLTPAGMQAAGLVRGGQLADGRRPLCSDAWLSAQGMPPGSSLVTEVANRRNALPVLSENNSQLAVRTTWGLSHRSADWSGVERDGMTDGGRLDASPTEMPLLADAPSADLPGQDLDGHGGVGRNVLFPDGHVGLLPAIASNDTSDVFLARGGKSAGLGISAPIVFVSGH